MILGVIAVALLIFLILFLTSAPLRETFVSITGDESLVTGVNDTLQPWLWVIVAALLIVICATAVYMIRRKKIMAGRR